MRRLVRIDYFLNLSFSQIVSFFDGGFLSSRFFQFVNFANFVFLKFKRYDSFMADLKINELAMYRLQVFVRLFGSVRGSLINLVSYRLNITTKLQRFDIFLNTVFSKSFLRYLFVSVLYRPGLFTNWRSNLPKFCLFSSWVKCMRGAGRVLGNSSESWFKRNKLTIGFPGIVVTVDGFRHLYLFSETERLLLPTLGPGVFFLNYCFWTYTYLVSKYTISNNLFFFRFFSLSYVGGRLSTLVFSEYRVQERF